MRATRSTRREPPGKARAPLLLVTGAVGFVGSSVLAALLRAGYRVTALVRSRKDDPAPGRLERVLRWHGVNDGHRIRLVDADLASPGLGLRAAAFASLARSLDGIVHCAASTTFDESKRAALYASNVGGTVHLLELAAASRLRCFHHMSTAFAAGRRDGLCLEALDDPPGFHNSYEASKHEAEEKVLEFGRARGIRAYVHRPSIIVGDSVGGRTLLFNAMYYPVRFSRYILDLLKVDIDRNGGRLAAEMGVRLREDGAMEVPVRLDTGPRGGGVLNLVPIDFVVGALLAVIAADDEAEPGIYHLVNGRPSSVGDLVAYTSRYFRLCGPAACASEEFVAAPKNALERRFEADIEVYRPYLRDTRHFDTTRADRVLEAAGVRCPVFDYELFRRCIDYALACDWRPLPVAPRAPVA